ncbi:hypothetical protein B0H65DRAFT_186579 [Neurospora tetraspora]|uniref:Uncharacterized protein n=1 Tax=Neurospora tetraspora TaxID=94610 RepID=A0AAE0JF29_9PEZI|nr:hypothetical protein B0H65DRAFT_186579 [Neurospora tetraspora]
MSRTFPSGPNLCHLCCLAQGSAQCEQCPVGRLQPIAVGSSQPEWLGGLAVPTNGIIPILGIEFSFTVRYCWLSRSLIGEKRTKLREPQAKQNAPGTLKSTFAMWLALTDERACFVRHQFPSGKLSQPTQCTMYTEAAYEEAGALVLLPDPCSVPWCRSIPVGQRKSDTSLYVQFTHPHRNVFFGRISGPTLTFYCPPACHTPSTTHAFLIPELSLPEFWPEHPLLITYNGLCLRCLLPFIDNLLHTRPSTCPCAPFWT